MGGKNALLAKTHDGLKKGSEYKSALVPHVSDTRAKTQPKWEAFHYLHAMENAIEPLPAGAGNARKRRCEPFPLPSPGPKSQPDVRPRPGLRRLAMPCARRLPLLAAAPASPRALQTFCSCNLGRQLLGDLLLGAACICATGILNAGPRLPGLCALHDAALRVCLPPARRRTSTPCMHMQTWRSPAVGLGPVL